MLDRPPSVFLSVVFQEALSNLALEWSRVASQIAAATLILSLCSDSLLMI